MDQSSSVGRSNTSSRQSSRRHDNSTDDNESSRSSLSSRQSEDSAPSRWLLCWHLLSWCFAILAHLAEGFVVVWAAIHYATFDLRFNLLLTVTCYFAATLLNTVISLFWYYDLDRVYLRQLRASGPFPGSYKRKCSFAAIISHCLLLGEVYRYGELIVRQLFSGQTTSINVLRRDATLLRFFHGLSITAPQIIIHLYTITVATDPAHPDHASYPVSMTVLLPVIGVSITSLLYSLSTYVTSDRLTSKTRRVILPAHVSLMGWYVCIVASRIIALTLFAHAFGYFVAAFLFAHWVLSVFGILNQKGQFCVDYAQQPRKQRWWLEVPFSLYAAWLYQFVFFSLREGTTRYAVSVYLVVTMIENVLMISLFYTEYSSLWYSPAAIAAVVGLYLIGTLLLVVYYLVLHPDKTGDWYWIGIPKKCCALPGSKSKSYRPHRVEISEPTLVNMNGEATNIQSRIATFQPLTSILTRNKTTGQMQLTAPPQVIDSGLSSQDDEYYKKPRVHAPQQTSLEFSSSNAPHDPRYPHSTHTLPGSHTPNHTFPGSHTRTRTLPIGHTQSPGSSEPASANEMNRIRILTIPTTASLGSSMKTDSDDLETPETGAPSLVPMHDAYIPPHFQHSVGPATNIQMKETSFHGVSGNVPNPNHNLHGEHLDTTSSSNPGSCPRDLDIDSPLVSPYDTLDTARREAAVALGEAETILKGNEIVDTIDGRLSASPPNLPTPDFSDQNLLLPVLPNQSSGSHDLQAEGEGGDKSRQQNTTPGVLPPPMTPQQKFIPNGPSHQSSVAPAPPPRTTPQQNFTSDGPPHQQSTTPTAQTSSNSAVVELQPQQNSTSTQLQMFQDIPAKRDYQVLPGPLEQHYFPEPSSHSTPNLSAASRGAKIATGVQSSAQNSSGGALDTRHRSLPPDENSASQNIITAPQNVPSLTPVKPEHKQAPSGVSPSNYSPNIRYRQRGGRGGSRNRNPAAKAHQSYYAYDNPTKQPPRPSPGRPHSFHVPQALAENRQRLFGRTLPGEGVTNGNHVFGSPWQQQKRSTIGHGVVPPPPVHKPPDRSRTLVPFQTNDLMPMRPRSYSEGTTLESSPAGERRNKNYTQSPNSQKMPPQFPPQYLGRSPGAPRRDPHHHQNYHTHTDRTQVLNLTWTSPRLHHDPAISGQSPGQQHKMMSYEGVVRGPVLRPPSHSPILKDRSQTGYELRGNASLMNGGRGVAYFNPPRNMLNSSQLGGGGGTSHLHGNRRQSTNQNPLLHIPAQGSHTSCV